MTTYRMTLLIDVHDARLARHDGEKEPPPNDIDDWQPYDLERAMHLGIASVDEIEDAERVEDDE